MSTNTPEPFKLAVDQTVLDDLDERLRRIRWPDDPDNEDGRFGVTRAYLEEFVAYWLDGYDWRTVEADINALPNFRVAIDDQVVHYVHVPGNGPDPLPLVLTHGWPWSYWDYRKVIGPLSDPGAHGGDPADAFDVIVPSIPGYGFSTPMRPGASAKKTAGLWVRLVRDVLGLDRFVTAGGDWGAVISIMMGHLYPDDLRGVYVTLPNFAPALRNRFEGFELDDLEPDERDWFEREWRRARARADPSCAPTATCSRPRPTPTPVPTARSRWRSRSSMAVCATARRTATSSPHSPARSSSPTRCSTGSHGRGVQLVASTGTRPATPSSSCRDAPRSFPSQPASACSRVRCSTSRRSSSRRDANLVHWSPQPAGGHFAACEQPALFVEDLRSFARKVRI